MVYILMTTYVNNKTIYATTQECFSKHKEFTPNPETLLLIPVPCSTPWDISSHPGTGHPSLDEDISTSNYTLELQTSYCQQF